MGSKTIILLGVLISALYLYFCISKYKVAAPLVQSGIVESEAVEQVAVPSEPVIPSINGVAPSITEEDKVDQNETDRISIPAFGFMTGAKKNQIVALMSDNDENGLLSKHLESLCKNRECSKDMRYENDIIDASWQKEGVKIIELLTDGSIENGSLFIEGNVLKLEGTINNQKTQDVLTDILNAVKSDTFKVENYTKLSPKQTLKNSEIKKVEPPKKETVVEKVEIKPAEVKKVKPKPLPKPKVEKVKPVPVVKETPVSTPVVSAESSMDTTLDTQSQITVEHSIDEDIEAVGIVAKPAMKTTDKNNKNTKKRVVKAKPAPKSEVIPEPVMETSLDAEARVRAILSEIKDSGPEVGVVAKPHMETTVE